MAQDRQNGQNERGVDILIVEDTPTQLALYQEYLRGEFWRVAIATNGEEALHIIRTKSPAMILLDLKLPDQDGLEILKSLHHNHHPATVIVMTAHGSVNIAVEAMQHGAYDFLMKPFPKDRLLVTLRNAWERQKLSGLLRKLKEGARDSYGAMVGASPAMQAVYQMIDQAASSQASIFIHGESGTGKELCAEAIHQKSRRNHNAFVPLNCAAIPVNLMESEIFGHVKGAFTGASSDRKGAAATAHQGTLFLDEICEMPLEIQAKFLRLVQSGTYQALGSDKIGKTDLRYICATNRAPWHEVEAGRFREDLYYRLHVIAIDLPPLREREGDVALLANHFLREVATREEKEFKGFASDVMRRFENYAWPGNVRQLRNVIEHIVAMNPGGKVNEAMLPSDMQKITPASNQLSPSSASTRSTPQDMRQDIRPLEEVERHAIEMAIQQCNDNVVMAAEKLGVSPSTLYRKIAKWGG